MDGAMYESRVAHVQSHLRQHYWPVVPLLLEPLNFDQIAERLGPGWTRREVEGAWYKIRDQLGLYEWGQRQGLGRVALLRVAVGLDECVCQKLARTL